MSIRDDFSGDWARDPHRGFGGDYARDGGWSGGGRADDFVREEPLPRSYRGRGPKNWRRDDEQIRELVNERLTDDHDVDATDIDVVVADAEVTLQGAVRSRMEKRIADDIAWSVAGVHDVHNRLRIEDRATHLGKASE